MILRVASLIALLQGLAHATMILSAKPRHGEAEIQLVAAMKANIFDFAGSPHSYWDFYTGYALIAAGVCLVESALLWLLAPLFKAEPRAVRPILALILLGNLGHAALIVKYFFLIPLVPDGLIAVTLALALFGARISPLARGAVAGVYRGRSDRV